MGLKSSFVCDGCKRDNNLPVSYVVYRDRLDGIVIVRNPVAIQNILVNPGIKMLCGHECTIMSISKELCS